MATNIKLGNPFSALGQLEPFRDVDDLFGARRLKSLMGSLPDEPQIRMDIKDDGPVYRVKAEIPGVGKEDIHVEIDGNSVSISAEVRRDEEEQRVGNTLCSERYYGRQSRSFTLHQDVDEAKAEARYQDGILELTLPKRTGTAAKQLTVK